MDQQHGAFTRRILTGTGTVVVKCPHCSAPGIFKAEDSADAASLQQWPGILVPPNDPRHNGYVGGTCPNCHKVRPPLSPPVTLFQQEIMP